jgi:predicted SAM-dependent methyltransferase
MSRTADWEGRARRLAIRALSRFGIDVRWLRTDRRSDPRRVRLPDGARLYVGCGEDERPGYVGCDVRALPTVQVVCRAWEISVFTEAAVEIYSRHSLEHLTDAEARVALEDWHRALRVGGTVEIVVPDMDFHLQQWRDASWSEAEETDPRSKARWGFAGVYGWQRDCEPTRIPYAPTYWDVHKSGYNARRITYLMERAGFGRVSTTTVDECHLVAKGTKITAKGERQVAPRIDGIRPDHVGRYRFALRYLPMGARVADAACGVGYGAKLVAGTGAAEIVYALDADEGALEYGAAHYGDARLEFRRRDLEVGDWPERDLDAVLSFETIEHLVEPSRFLEAAFTALKDDGILICSTPNERMLAFSPSRYPHHQRHFTPEEFSSLLESAGFRVVERYTQTSIDAEAVDPGWHGLFNIAVCRKNDIAVDAAGSR